MSNSHNRGCCSSSSNFYASALGMTHHLPLAYIDTELYVISSSAYASSIDQHLFSSWLTGSKGHK
jgi:hypothetical protein